MWGGRSVRCGSRVRVSEWFCAVCCVGETLLFFWHVGFVVGRDYEVVAGLLLLES